MDDAVGRTGKDKIQEGGDHGRRDPTAAREANMDGRDELGIIFDEQHFHCREAVTHLDPGIAPLFDYEPLFSKQIDPQPFCSISDDLFKCHDHMALSDHSMNFVQEVMAEGESKQEDLTRELPSLSRPPTMEDQSPPQPAFQPSIDEKQEGLQKTEAVEELPTFSPCNEQLEDLKSYLECLDSVGRTYGAVKVKLPQGWRHKHMKSDLSRLNTLKFHCESKTLRYKQLPGCDLVVAGDVELRSFLELQDSLRSIRTHKEDGEKTIKATADTFSLLHAPSHENLFAPVAEHAESYPCVLSLGSEITASGWSQTEHETMVCCVHVGGSRTAYVVPPAHREDLSQLSDRMRAEVRSKHGKLNEKDELLIDPEELAKNGIPVRRATLGPDEVIIHWKDASHLFVDEGFICNEFLDCKSLITICDLTSKSAEVRSRLSPLESDNSSCKLLDDAEDANQPEWAVRRRRKRVLTHQGTKSILSAPVELKNKNCHYCEHAPKRCSNFTCLSPNCDQKFCDKCCKLHLHNPTHFKSQDDADRLDWRCPVCTRKCCCTMETCHQDHIHCKRYRRRMKNMLQAFDYYFQ
mmetsp:Transcript_20967/g.69948  ORF Transcript_20967/g.69948 Transcript_20967/m.69948 type:complete len:578 (+) Transcript_20967:2-1735(+)